MLHLPRGVVDLLVFSQHAGSVWFVAGVCPFLFNKIPGPLAEKEGREPPADLSSLPHRRQRQPLSPHITLNLLSAKGAPIFSGYTASHQHCPAIWKHHCRVSWFHMGLDGHQDLVTTTLAPQPHTHLMARI